MTPPWPKPPKGQEKTPLISKEEILKRNAEWGIPPSRDDQECSGCHSLHNTNIKAQLFKSVLGGWPVNHEESTHVCGRTQWERYSTATRKSCYCQPYISRSHYVTIENPSPPSPRVWDYYKPWLRLSRCFCLETTQQWTDLSPRPNEIPDVLQTAF